ncbi:cell division protein FtsK [Mycobacteroides abscessus]|uniref:FtsK/SpoIIIE domain-containing protein n=1 Tax=Mycobacteroides abscessus TaxID=36809 RepID=UPI0005E07A3C|nr:FtsK/SpoIIIE domain-containing protein [Mycobacteroides abscessus]PVB15160.1 hypothetical protein DDJ68_09235 [Mycobacteroides abscessus]RIR97159.1 hypothetical protein D2E57_07435 [Mycobacteroides abscessus]CPW79335.1 cell division protein FtsK [Mycobacteroides abscessus]CRG57375.1 cell division protein FtsK [Mycobacteroides abscessus]SLA06905.1 cell division protein FtsK [Mycobacteroides abscessus subsp. abscessus]
MTNNYFALLGINRPEDLRLETQWGADEGPNSPVDVPVGRDRAGQTLSFNFSRFAGTDDHHLIVAAPGAGTTTLLRALTTGLRVRRSPRFHNLFIIEGKPRGEYRDFAATPGIVGRVDPRDDGTQTAWRLGQVLVGEIERRRAVIEAAGAAGFSDYQMRTRDVHDVDEVEIPWLPELYIVVDNIDWLVGTDFDDVLPAIRADGNALGIKLIIGTSYDTWSRLNADDYFDNVTPRFTLGLTAQQSSSVFGADVSEDLINPGEAYLHTHDGTRTRFTVVPVE